MYKKIYYNIHKLKPFIVNYKKNSILNGCKWQDINN